MKYIAFWEWNEEDIEKGIEKTRIIDEEREKYPGRYVRPLFGSWLIIGKTRGFSLVEGTEEQAKNWEEFYKPELKKVEFAPIINAKEFIEDFERKKK